MRAWSLKSILAVALLSASSAFGNLGPPADFPADAWLHGPARQDFPWKVQVHEPWLGFQQRIIVQVRAIFRVRDLHKRGISIEDLHVIFRVADKDGHWFPGESYRHLAFDPDIKPGDELDIFLTAYAKPGDYAGDLLIYDARSRKGNVWHGPLHVSPLRDDPLPGADRDLPAVQCLAPTAAVTSRPGRPLTSMVNFDPAAFEEARLQLPVSNEHPIQVDILANLSLSDATNTRFRQAPDWMYKINADTLLQIAHVVSQLDLKNGCVRFSAIDVLRQEAFVDRESADSMDWQKMRQKLMSLQRNKIAAKVLGRQKLSAVLLARYVEQLINGPSACASSGPPPIRVLIMIGDAFIFPYGTEMRAVQPESPDVRGYYLKVTPIGSGNWDQVERLLKPLHPWRSEFSDSRRFRQALASLIAEIEKLANQPPATNQGD